MIETSVRHETVEVEEQGCAGCGDTASGLMNGAEKGWEKPFYCVGCNPRFATKCLATTFAPALLGLL